MGLLLDRRTQVAVYAAVGAALCGLAWALVAASGTVPVGEGYALVGFALVSTGLLAVNLWLAYRASAGFAGETDEAPSGPFVRRRRGLRR